MEVIFCEYQTRFYSFTGVFRVVDIMTLGVVGSTISCRLNALFRPIFFLLQECYLPLLFTSLGCG